MRSQRSMKVFLAAAVAALAMSAAVVSTASATIVQANFSSSQFTLSTTGLTVKKDGLDPRVCTFKSAPKGEGGGGQFYVYNNFEGDTRFYCPTWNTQLQMILSGNVTFDTVTNKYSFTVNPYPSMNLTFSPWGSYWQSEPISGNWVNGSGTTASTITFTDQWFGTTNKIDKLTISGTVKVTTPTGGLITLSH